MGSRLTFWLLVLLSTHYVWPDLSKSQVYLVQDLQAARLEASGV